MSKNIVIKLKSAGSRTTTFSISDDLGNVLFNNISKQSLILGQAVTIEDSVKVLIITSTGKNCCNKTWNISIANIDHTSLAAIEFKNSNTGSLWRHLTDPTLYNNYYGCIAPYIIEYPFAYEYYDEILQNVKDYTKVYKYLPSLDGVWNYNRKVQTNDKYFNKAIVYNDQQSSGILELISKPKNNLSTYLTYPKFNSDSKTITFTKSDNFYQFNTFWNVAIDSQIPLFTNTCESLSLDKEVNQDNMNYSTKSFKKETIRAKDSKVRLILDNSSETHLVSQILFAPSQISYK